MNYLCKYRLLTIVNFDGFLSALPARDEDRHIFEQIRNCFVARYSDSLTLHRVTDIVSTLSGVEWLGEERIRPLLSRLVREGVLRSRRCSQHHVTLWEVNH